MTENVRNLVMEEKQTSLAQRVPNKLDPKRPTLKHTINKTKRLKDKDRILKAVRERQVVIYKGAQLD